MLHTWTHLLIWNISTQVLYHSINYIVNQFKAMNVFVSIQIHFCTTELKLNMVSSKLIAFCILMKSLKKQYRFSLILWEHVNHHMQLCMLHYNGTRCSKLVLPWSVTRKDGYSILVYQWPDAGRCFSQGTPVQTYIWYISLYNYVSIGWNLEPQNLGGLQQRCMSLFTLLLDFHTYAIITYCTFYTTLQ
jgi:hypothetical protein